MWIYSKATKKYSDEYYDIKRKKKPRLKWGKNAERHMS